MVIVIHELVILSFLLLEQDLKFGFVGAINPSEIRFQRMKSSRGEDEIRLRRMKSALRAGCGTDPSGLFIKIQF
jgi:hypothetical protein